MSKRALLVTVGILMVLATIFWYSTSIYQKRNALVFVYEIIKSVQDAIRCPAPLRAEYDFTGSRFVFSHCFTPVADAGKSCKQNSECSTGRCLLKADQKYIQETCVTTLCNGKEVGRDEFAGCRGKSEINYTCKVDVVGECDDNTGYGGTLLPEPNKIKYEYLY